MINEIIFYNNNIDTLRSLRSELNRKRGPGPRTTTSLLDTDNYEILKLDELSDELNMRRELIIDDLVPMILNDIDIFGREVQLLNGLIQVGANSVSLIPLSGISGRDVLKLATTVQNNQYLRLLNEMRRIQGQTGS